MDLRETLGHSSDEPIPKLSRSPTAPTAQLPSSTASSEDVDMSPNGPTKPAANAQAYAHAQAAASHISFLRPEDLLSPTMLTREEMDEVILALRKKALVEEYFGVEGA